LVFGIFGQGGPTETLVLANCRHIEKTSREVGSQRCWIFQRFAYGKNRVRPSADCPEIRLNKCLFGNYYLKYTLV